MFNFLKENSYLIFKMIVNQIGMTMFGLVLSMPTSVNDNLFLLSSVFAVVFYLFLLYTMTWDIGYEEKTRIDAKRMRLRPLKGFFMSLTANLINLILGVLIAVGYYTATAYQMSEAGILFPTAPLASVNLFGTARTIATILEGMYAGIINRFFLSAPYIYLLIPIPAMITCTIAYLAGVKGKRLLPFFAPKEKRD